MAAKRRRGPGSTCNISEEEEEEVVVVVDDSESDATISEHHHLARLRLRQRWELASVLNFLHVFEPVIQSDLKMSAEEIETALISANDALGQIHIALLKGIPPVCKNLIETGAWVTLVCKKLAPWWPWVAEGENPLKCNNGEEIKRYKEFHPTTRLLMLKALCEVRAEQDDMLRHITDELKAGAEVSNFRKERIGSAENGITYWYDGDPNIGHRLYKEVINFDTKPKSKGKSCPMPSAIHSEWETLATNLEEFREISEKLSSSMSKSEVFVGEIIRTDLLPVLEELQKKKERALKRKQRHAMLLDNVQNSPRVEIIHTRRQRNPVCYTFEEFDRSINEAIIQMSKTAHTKGVHGDGSKQAELVSSHNDKLMDGAHLDNQNSGHEVKDDDHNQGSIDDRNEDVDYDARDDDYSSADSDHDFLGHGEQENTTPRQTQVAFVQDEKNDKPNLALGLRGRLRNAVNTNRRETRYHAEMKKRLRQRPTRNPEFSETVVLDSEDDDMPAFDKQT